MSELPSRAAAALGIAVFIAIAWAFSEHRRRFPARVVAWGLALQLALALLLLRSAAGRAIFLGVNEAVNAFIGFTDAGTDFVFGALRTTGFSFALEVLPVIIVMGSLFSVLYHWGAVQLVVRALARGLSRAMGISAAESLSAVADVFVGMTEAPLLIRPYLARMTRSELFTVMTAGMATIAGSVLVAYAKMLGSGDFAGHLVTASFMAAPAAVLLAKVMVPETAVPETSHASAATVAVTSVNTIDAAAAGASAALRLAANVGGLLIAFIALLAMVNAGLEHVGGWLGVQDLTLQRVLGWGFAPFALLLGIAPGEAQTVGSLLGVKTVLNEFLAYRDLGALIAQQQISPRAAVISSYALCGFANFGSLAILLGGVGAMVPERRPEIAQLGLKAILAGTLATMMTASVVAVLV
ncbi:MAG TPA: nucleoside transporter C-terminal domain-containing protein [Myxococcota bacterium]|nr:nucleoside transporter C-terminal domain-containing protein [Myxococcota bacterium]